VFGIGNGRPGPLHPFPIPQVLVWVILDPVYLYSETSLIGAYFVGVYPSTVQLNGVKNGSQILGIYKCI